MEALRTLLPDIVKEAVFEVYLDGKHKGVVKRDYAIEYALYGSRQHRKTATQMRRRNRRVFEMEGIVQKGDGTHIHHRDGDVNNNDRSNLVVLSHCAHSRAHGYVCHKDKQK